MSGTLDFDPEDMTVEEVEEVETRTGQSLEELFDSMQGGGMPSGKQLRAIAFVLKRREDPEFTWEQAGKFKLAAITELASGPKDRTGSTTS